MKDPAEGTATVVSYSEHHEQKGNDVVLDAQLMMQAEGLVPATVDARPRVPQSWMPVKLGTEWPVRLDRARPERFEILYDRVPAVSPPPGAAPAQPPGVPAAPFITQSVQSFSYPPSIQVMGGTPEQAKQAIDMAEKMMGMDLDGDGKVAGGAAPAGGASPMSAWLGAAQQAYSAYSVPQTPAAPAPQPASDDPVTKLERLAKLLDAGDITREEFDAQKKKLLGS